MHHIVAIPLLEPVYSTDPPEYDYKIVLHPACKLPNKVPHGIRKLSCRLRCMVPVHVYMVPTLNRTHRASSIWFPMSICSKHSRVSDNASLITSDSIPFPSDTARIVHEAQEKHAAVKSALKTACMGRSTVV